jgi:aminoglycoside phosphotransferase family enzyme
MAELPPLVQALLKGDAYPENPRHVDLTQTQMSFVFLLGDFAYKVKKPVNLGYLDFTTLEKRRFFCQQEVELNSRLAPEVYLGVVEVTQNEGRFSVGGTGDVVEYAVKMRQLPRERCLDKLLARDQATPAMLVKVAHKLVKFHQSSRFDEEISIYGDIETIVQNTEENFAQTTKYIKVSLSQEKYDRIRSYTTSFIESQTPLFKRRIEEDRIRDCHGDLHSAHICFGDEVYIFDCIEFNDRFRYCDVASEIAFLAMDLDVHGYPHLANYFVEAYVALSGDRELEQLLNFYKCYRAYVRGKVESFKLDDPHISEEEKSQVLGIAGRYFELAESYALRSE